MKRRIYEPGAQAVTTGVDARTAAVATSQAARCPACAASFSWVSERDLAPIPVEWRCAPGQAPRSFELTCRSCGKRSILHLSKDGLSFASDASAEAIRASARERAHEAATRQVLGRDDND